jgi:ElaB/YqjD/DUF883 family membrane-anchored ribosome-binding protein
MNTSIGRDPLSSELPSSVSGAVSGQTVDRVVRTAHNAVDRVAGTASSAVERVRSGLSGAASTVSDKMHGLSDTRAVWVDNCRQSVREHPIAAVGIGLAAGYLIARILRSER